MKTIALLSAITLTSCATAKPVANDKPKEWSAGDITVKLIDVIFVRIILNAVL